MMDSDFEAIKVAASVAPNSADWPTGDVQVSIAGDKPTIKGELHWLSLHGAKDEARDLVMRTLGALAGIDTDKTLSLDGKKEAKAKAAQAALAAMEKSQALAKAQDTVTAAIAKFDKQLAPPPVDPTVAAEIRAHVARLRDGERLVFVTRNIAEAGPAILGAPAFLSRVTPDEQNIVRQQYERQRNPEAAEAKSKAVDALQHLEQGFRNAANTIRSSAGLDNASNGAAA